ncbi:MAG: elongation factor P [Alphaproteobacteria bacterium]|nr:elongation factor P [Alphaproteobacteria bacterium]
MKVNANTLRKGNVIEHNGKLWAIVSNQLLSPGKGAAVAQVEMRDVRSGAKDNVRFRTQEQVERVRLEQDEFQFLYADGDDYNFMNTKSFEQIVVKKDIIGMPAAAFLQEGMIVEIESFEGEPLSAQIPDTAVVTVTEAEPVIKGQTATTSYKPAIVDNGLKIMVPPFIDVGTKIVVRTEDASYVERAK